MATIHTQVEARRGCGFRKEGGIYLMSLGLGVTCEKLPIPLTVCPCCSAGIKPSRGWTWIGRDLIDDTPCRKKGCDGCPPFSHDIERYGLLWIGGKFYKTPQEFTAEAMRMGVSRRIPAVPKGFVLGETWVLVAHRDCIPDPEDPEKFIPGIFHAFRPTAIEYIVKGDETEKELDRLEKRGMRLVKVVPDGEQLNIVQ